MSFKNGKNIWLKTGLRISEEFFSSVYVFRSSHFPSKVENNYFEGCSRQKQDQSKKLLLSPPAGPPKFGVAGRRPIQCPLSFLCLSFWNGPQFYKSTENARLEYFGTALMSSDSQLLDQQLIWNGPYSKTDEVLLDGSWFWKSRPSVIEIYFGRDLQFPAVLRIKL